MHAQKIEQGVCPLHTAAWLPRAEAGAMALAKLLPPLWPTLILFCMLALPSSLH